MRLEVSRKAIELQRGDCGPSESLPRMEPVGKHEANHREVGEDLRKRPLPDGYREAADQKTQQNPFGAMPGRAGPDNQKRRGPTDDSEVAEGFLRERWSGHRKERRADPVAQRVWK